MKKTLIIDGGLGRNVAAIPALEEFVKRNPDSYIITSYWTGIFWGNKLLTDRIFDSGTKGLFDKIKDTKIIKPEPYYNTDFLNGRISMMEAFNREINGDGVEIKKPKLHLTKFELNSAKSKINNEVKTIVFQPFGSTAQYQYGDIVDETLRSLNIKNTFSILERLEWEQYQVILFDTKNVDFGRRTHLNDLGYRQAAAVIANCDYFIGVDSCGQHIAYALDKPGTTFFGGSNSTNFGYADWFKIVEKNIEKKPQTYRLCETDVWLNNIHNDGILEFDSETIDNICEDIVKDIKNKTE